jgi:hypothetical protein
MGKDKIRGICKMKFFVVRMETRHQTESCECNFGLVIKESESPKDDLEKIIKYIEAYSPDKKINWTEESQKDNIPNNLSLYNQDGWEHCLMSIIEDGDHGQLIISEEFAETISNALFNLPAKRRQKREEDKES